MNNDNHNAINYNQLLFNNKKIYIEKKIRKRIKCVRAVCTKGTHYVKLDMLEYFACAINSKKKCKR